MNAWKGRLQDGTEIIKEDLNKILEAHVEWSKDPATT